MTQTPWGNSEQLRAHKLAPGLRLPAEEVADNQRRRLLAAMVACVAEHGYERTSVGDVVELSGVSRTAFYRHFVNKEDCFVAAVDGTIEFATAAITGAYRNDGSWDVRLAGAFNAYVGEILAQPAAARICLLDAFVAGPTAIDRANRGGTQFEQMIHQSFEQSPDHVGLPPLVIRGIVGGVRKVMATRLRLGQEATLAELAPGLGAWALSHRAPTTAIRRPRVRPAPEAAFRLDEHDQVARIFAALSAVVREKGYLATTLDDVAERSAISFSTFYNHFRTKQDAFMATYDAGLARAYAVTLPPYQRAEDWPHAVRAGLEGLFTYLSRDPNWAHVGIVEVLAAGPRGMEHRDRALTMFTDLLRPGFETAPHVPPIACEAIGGALFELLYDHIRARGSQRVLELLPTATFIALAPFVGPEEAAAVANERPMRRAGAAQS
jgi:AcrR family transcriptional regulator